MHAVPKQLEDIQAHEAGVTVGESCPTGMLITEFGSSARIMCVLNLRAIFPTPNVRAFSLCGEISPHSCPPEPGSLACSFFLWIHLFETFQTRGILQYMAVSLFLPPGFLVFSGLIIL